MLKNNKTNVYYAAFIVVSVIFIAGFSAFTKLCPYTLDDWAWSGVIGDDRLRTLFDKYNGRYFGNFMILLISRSERIKTIIMSISFYLACLVPYLLSGARRISVLVFSGLTFVLLPKPIFVQVISWASGFANYVPPILLLAIYLLMIKNIFSDNPPEYGKEAPCLAFIIAFSAAMFMENVTLASIAIAVLVIVYTRLVHKKFCGTHVAFLVGAVLGAVIMFKNSAYGAIADNSDSYRSMAASDGQVSAADSFAGHLYKAVNFLFISNTLICIICTVLCAVLCVIFLRKARKAFEKRIAVSAVALNAVALVLFICRNNNRNFALFQQEKSNMIFWIIIALLYSAGLCLTIIFCVTDRNEKFKLLLLLITVPTLIAPLTVVNPVTARCFYPPYFMLTALLASMLGYILRESEEDFKKIEFALIPIAVAGISVFSLNYYGIFTEIHNYDLLSREYIVKQVANNEEKICVIDYPNSDYLLGSKPPNALWESRYKIYFNIPQEKKIVYLQKEDFDRFVSDYNTKIKK